VQQQPAHILDRQPTVTCDRVLLLHLLKSVTHRVTPVADLHILRCPRNHVIRRAQPRLPASRQ
jgi:hypothetical protein